MKIQEYKLNMNFNYLVILAILIALGVAGRLLPHPPNFTPMAAIALFAVFIFLKMNPLFPIHPFPICSVWFYLLQFDHHQPDK